MEIRKKLCTQCKKNPVWKNRTVNGVKLSLCIKCNAKLDTNKVKDKKASQKAKKKATVTEKKLDNIFSLWIRHCYPSKCHSEMKRMEPSKMQCAHFIGRNNRCVRFDTRNCYPTSPWENMYNQLHVLELAKRLKEYYNIDFENFISASKKQTCKLDSVQRKEMYEIFQDGYTRAADILFDYENGNISEKTYLDKLTILRQEVILKTKIIM